MTSEKNKIFSTTHFKKSRHIVDSTNFQPDPSLLTSLINSLPLNIYAKDVEGRFIFANNCYCVCTGKEHSEIIGKTDFDIHPSEMARKYREDDQRVMDSQQAESLEEERDSIGGGCDYVQVIKAPLLDNAHPDKVVGTIGIFWDITGRKQMEMNLAEERNLLRTVIDNLPDIIYVKDRDSRFVLANNALASYVGEKQPQDLIGKSDFDYFSHEQAQSFYNDEQRIINEECQINDVEEPSQVLGNEKRHFLSTKLPLHNISGDPIGIVGIAHDITARKQLEAQLQHSQRMETVGTLVAGIAHDFNNHLSVINGYAELLQQQNMQAGSSKDNFLEKILHAGKSAASLVNQLMAFSRKQVLQPKVIDFNRQLQNIVALLKPVLGEKISVQLNLSPDLWYIYVDPTQIEQVIMNLAANARNAIQGDGTLQFTTENINIDSATSNPPDRNLKDGEYIRITVSDSGHGIRDEHKNRIFEPFFTTKEKHEGSGLGLATVLGIVQQNKGSILVRNNDESPGTAFEIYLPREQNGSPEKEKTSLKIAVQGGTETILIVEDEKDVRGLAQTILTGKGYRVHCVSGGEEALQKASELNAAIDLLLTDIVMPGLSGKDLANQLNQQIPTLKILFMSGYTDNILTQHDFDKSSMGFIQKPFKADTLARKVRELLDS